MPRERPQGATRRVPVLIAGMVLVAAACAPGGGVSPSAPASPTATSSPSPAGSPEPSASATGSVKVGFISPTTGFVAALGTDMKRGWELYWTENGATVGGVTVETVFEDDTGDPEVALSKARRLVEEEDVQLVAGPILANTAYAVADYVAGQGLPTLQMTGADDLTQRRFNPLVMRVGYTSSQSNFPAGQWAYDQGHRNVITLCPDYAFGWESCGGFVSAFVDAGGTITDQIWHPLGTQDFSSYVTQIQAASPDAVFVGSAGGPDAILLYQSWTDFGLAGEVPIIGNCCFSDQVFLREIGSEATGITSFSYWAEGRDDPTVQAFVEAYEAEHGEIPSLYAAGAYTMAQVLARTLEETGGTIDGEGFIDAARGLTLDDALYGSLTWDDTNNVVGPVYRTEIAERDDGTLWNVVQETFDEVSQFWTYGKDAFLENPVFSREFTGQ